MFPLLALAAGLTALGCQDKPAPESGGAKTTPVAKPGGKHEHWWCREHGIPEHECLMCLHSEEELKKKGDWCETHEYAKSQCFACNPALKERYAAQYRAKYGKEPPEPEENPGKPDADPGKGKAEPDRKDKK
jgi:hypothetical protein